MATLRSALLDDDSSGEEFVPEEEAPEPDEQVRGRKKRKEAPVELLADAELDSLWAEMNGGAAPARAPAPRPAARGQAPAAAGPAADLDALLAQVQQADRPAMATETVRFAGEEVQVKVKVRREETRVCHVTLNAAPQSKPKTDNVSALLDDLKSKPKKISTIEKSEMDWEAHKQQDKTVSEELNRHMRGGTYLEKVSFLKRAELREYEIEREAKRK